MSSKYHHGTGRRKTSIARVRLYPGTGNIVVNDKPVEQYFSREADVTTVYSPLRATNTVDQFQVLVKVSGGGITGQAKERKKPGLKRARKAPQYTKR
jgi:small subunit ribosomal protein S9